MPGKLFVYGVLMGRGVAARLPNYQLGFAGFATVRPASGKMVYGELLDVDDATLRYYDQVEGVRSGYYQRNIVQAIGPDGLLTECWVYSMTDFYDVPNSPHPGLLRQMSEAYTRHGHPISALYEAVEANGAAV